MKAQKFEEVNTQKGIKDNDSRTIFVSGTDIKVPLFGAKRPDPSAIKSSIAGFEFQSSNH